MDETSGSSVLDIAGGHHGTALPGAIGPFGGPGPVTSSLWPPPVFPPGFVKTSLFFYGNRRVEVPHHSALDPGLGELTMDAWVIYASAGSGQQLTVVGKSTPAGGYELFIQDFSVSMGFLVFRVINVGSFAAPISPGQWHHVAATITRPTPNSTQNLLYIDGTLANSFGPLATGLVGSGASLLIGGDGVNAGEIAVDEVELFNRALTQQEVQDLHSAGQAGKCKRSPCVTPPAGMVAWYPLDEPPGASSVSDIAGFNNSGAPRDANGGPTLISTFPGPPPAGPVPVTSPPLSLPSGQVNGALYFYGPSVEVPNHPDLNFGNSDFSIDAWIRPVQVGPGFVQPIVDKLELAFNGLSGYAFYVENQQLRFAVRTNLILSTFSSPANSITFSVWTHVAVTVKAGLSPAVVLYVNGIPVTTSPAIPPLTVFSAGSNTALWIGESRLPGGRGEIAVDELEIFNRELTAMEVQSIFNAGGAGKCKSQPVALPDLVVKEVGVTGPLGDGNFLVSFRVENQGLAPVEGRVNHELRLISAGGDQDGILLDTVTTNTLAPSASQRFVVPFRIMGAGTSVRRIVRVIADSDSRVKESNELNNVGESAPFEF
ncbi:MAG: hypothetical protein HY650_06225 [Acidobacteria bacterium]|nr:hypothetical protein [Acidobacteriota bacterium]